MSQAENNDKIKKYIPYGLGIVTILLVIVILTVGSQNLSKRQSVTVGTTASTTTHQCTKSDWIGDGFCDDETNNPECDYDGDDCCGEAVFADYCSECTCVRNETNQNLMYTITTTTRVKPTGDSSLDLCLLKDWVGDGICDDTTNTKKCNYDGNDCCEGTYGLCYKCLCHLTKETNRIETEYFPNCTIFTIGDGRCDWWNYNELCGFDGGDCATTTTTTLAPEGCMKPLWVGDGFCDDETNDEDCNYDGGDCCTENPNVDYCNDCECK